MKRSLKELLSYNIETKDKKSGYANDFLFDDKAWFIRFLKVDFGHLFSPEKVIIPRVFLKKPGWDEKHFPIEMEMSDIEKFPRIEDHLPVSRNYEKQLYEHYNLKPYWYSAYTVPPAGAYYPIRPIKVPEINEDEPASETILRSFNEIKNYHIEAIDGKFGHVEDLIIDDKDWQIVYVVVDTSNWLPWSKKVLIAIDWLTNISFVKREITIKLYIDNIKNAPAYKPSDFIDEGYEQGLHDFYSTSLLK